MVLPTSGRGQVRGVFKFDTSDLERAKQVSVQSSRAIRESLKQTTTGFQQAGQAAENTGTIITRNTKKIADGFRNAETSAKRFARTDLGTIRNGLKGIADQFAGISLGAGLLVGQGLRSAASIEQINIRFKNMLGSQAAAEKLMGEIGERARELGQPVRSAQQAAAALLPTLEGSTDQLKIYIGLASRLSALNPQEGLAGAAFSIREAVSSGGTDLVSLAERFNIPRKKLRDAIEDAKKQGVDDFTAFGNALDKILNDMGLTEQAAQELAGTLTTQVSVALEEVNTAGGVAFEPLMETLVPLLKDFSAFIRNLRETNPELLRLGSIGVLAAAGIAPLSFALTKAIDLFTTLKKLSGNPLVIKAAVTGLAVTGGLELGRTITKGIASQANDPGLQQRLAAVGSSTGDLQRINKGEDPLAVAGERFKQVIVVVADGFLELARLFTKGGTWIANAIDQIINVLRLFGTFFSELTGTLKKLVGGLVVAIADATSGLSDTTNLRLAGQAIQASGQADQDAALQERERLTRRLAEGFTVDPAVIANIDREFDKVENSLIGGLANFLFPVQQAAADTAQQLAQAGQQVQAPQQASFSQEMVEAFGEFQDDIKEIEAKSEQERLKLVANFEKDRLKLEADQRKELLDFNKRYDAQELELVKQRQGIIDDAAKAEIEALEKFQADERKARRSHRLTLFQAALRLDAAAVFQENKRYKEEGKTRKEEFDAAAKAREQQKAEALQALADRAIELQNARQVDLQELMARQSEQREALNIAHAERMTQLQDQLAQEKAQREQAFIDTFNKLATDAGFHQDQMLGIQKTGLAAMEADLKAWYARQRANAASLLGGSPLSPRPYTSPTNPLPPPTQTGNGGGFNPGYLAGSNYVPKTGTYQLEKGEGVLRPDMMRMLARMTGSPAAATGNLNQLSMVQALAGGSSRSNTIGEINQNFHGMNNLDPQQQEAMIERVLYKILGGND